MFGRIDRRWRGTSAHACTALHMPSVSLCVRKHQACKRIHSPLHACKWRGAAVWTACAYAHGFSPARLLPSPCRLGLGYRLGPLGCCVIF